MCLTLLYFYYEMHIASDNQCADGQAQPYCKNWFDKQRKQEFPWPSGTLYCTKTGCSMENSKNNLQSYKSIDEWNCFINWFGAVYKRVDLKTLTWNLPNLLLMCKYISRKSGLMPCLKTILKCFALEHSAFKTKHLKMS